MSDSSNLSTNTEIPVPGLSKKTNNILGNKKVLIAGAILLAILVFIVVFFMASSQNNKFKTLVDNADTAYTKADYKEVQKNLTEALKIKKDEPAALSQLITSISMEGNRSGQETEQLKKSQPYIDEALKTNPNNLSILIAAGYAYETAGDYDKALSYYQQAVKADPKSSDAWFHLGHDLEFLGKRKEAYQNYDKAFALEPNNPLVLMARGNQLLADDKKEEAFQSFKKASEDKNLDYATKAEALTGAAIVRLSQKSFEYSLESLALAKEAAQTDPSFSPGLAAYGYDLFLTGKPDEGVTYLNKAIDANPKISKNFYLLGLIYAISQDYVNAIKYTKFAIIIIKDDNTIFSESDKNSARATYTYQLAKIYSSSDVNTDIVPLIKEAVSLKPSIKTNLKQDVQNGLFKNLTSNQQFQAIINN